MQGGGHVAAAQQGGNFLLDVLGLAFFHHQHAAFANAEVGNLVRHQGAGDVEHQQRNFGFAKRIGQAELLQRANQRVVQTALHDDAEVRVLAVKVFVQSMRFDVGAGGRNALLVLELFVAKGDGRVGESAVVKLGGLVHQMQC